MTAGGAAQPGLSDQEHPVTVTGKVVDAACCMLHPPAATTATPVWFANQAPLAAAATLGELRSLGGLRSSFNSDRGKARIILLLSPT
jgi:hypothetical protein